MALNTNMDLDLAGPIVDVAAVLSHQGWLVGTHGQFDSQKGKLTKNNFALGYQTGDFALHTNVWVFILHYSVTYKQHIFSFLTLQT